VTIPTQGVGQSKAISNIKNILQQNKAIFYAFFLPNKTAWDAFRNTWNNYNESKVWYPDSYCGQSAVKNEFGGHAVLLVGYNDEDPNVNNHYWIILNSWGTANGNRPNGLFRVPMYINYDCTIPNGSAKTLAHQFLTLDITFNPAPPPAQKPNLVPYQPSGWSDKIVVSKTTGDTTDSSSFSTSDTLYVDFAVLNNSNVDVNSKFYAALYVDGTLRNSWSWDSMAAHTYGYVNDYSIGSLSAGTHTIKVVADSTGVISESYESDNEYTKTITVQAQSSQKPNLKPYQPSGWSDRIVVSNTTGTTTDKSSFKTTDTLYVDWAVVNDSSVNISNRFYISLYVDGVFKNSWYCSSLDAGYYTYNVNYALGPLGSGSHTISIVADVNQEVAESSETDNNYSKTITVEVDKPSQQLPNLAAYKPKDWSSAVVVSTSKGRTTDSSSLTGDDFLYLNWAVLNSGPVATPGGFSVDLYVDGYLENYWSRSSSLKSNYYWPIKDYPLGYLSGGDHLIELVVDSLSEVSESKENDNYYSKWITVKGSFFFEMFPSLKPYQPEGWLDKIVIYSSNKKFADSPYFTTQDTLYVNWAVINDGLVDTERPFFITLSVDGTVKKSWKIQKLKANESYVIKNLSIGKVSAGVHTFSIVVDPEGVIREDDKTDNEYHVTVEVLQVP
jgi:subtilase family serine protease